jgi:hypothetical protein
MNINIGDALLTSVWPADAVIASGIVYGTDIPLGDPGRFLEGRVKVRFYITTTFVGAGDAALVLYGGAAAAPTAVLKTVATGLKIALIAGTTWELVLESHELKAFNRLGINNTGAASAGAFKADFVPIKS